ncbi:MAG: acyl-CoA thioesterase [Rhodoferax sp.]
MTPNEPAPFALRFRVRYAECDAQMVVFNARWGDYADLAATEYLRAALGGIQALHAQGLDTQVVHYAIDWRAPARFDEVLEARLRCTRVGNTSFTVAIDFAHHASAQVLAQAQLVYVLVRWPGLQKAAIDAALAHALRHGAAGCCCDQSGA